MHRFPSRHYGSHARHCRRESRLSSQSVRPNDPSFDSSLFRSIAAPAALICLSSQGVFRGLQDTKTPLAITLAANSINFLLDPLLIYGFHMGVKGAALATAFAEITSAMAYLALLWRRRKDLGLDRSLSDALQGARANYLPFLESGGTVLLRTSFLIGTKTLASSVATHLGAVSIAAHQVLAQLWLLHSLLSDSLAIAGTSLIASELATASHRLKARDVSDRLLELAAYLGTAMAVLYTLGYPILPYIFTQDRPVIDAIQAILPLAIVMLPLNSTAFVFDGIFIGAKDFDFMALSMGASSLAACISLLMVEPHHWGLAGIWYCQSGLMVLRFGVLGARYLQPSGPIPPKSAV